MDIIYKKIIIELINLSRRSKRIILISIDFLTMLIALWCALYLRLSEFYTPPTLLLFWVFLSAPIIGLIVFHHTKVYRQVTRYADHSLSARIIFSSCLTVLIWAMLILLVGAVEVPRSVIIMFGVLTSLFIWTNREIARWLLKDAPLPKDQSQNNGSKRKVIIYGAGTTGIQLLEALKSKSDYEVVGFIDDNQCVVGQRIQRLKVYPTERIQKFIVEDGVKEVFLAIPEASWTKRRGIVKSLETYKVLVKTLPAIGDIASGQVEVSDLKQIDVLDLLCRAPIPSDPKLLGKNISDKVVVVTGAGGSIGSEISRQILKQKPKILILFDLSEAALYEIDMELRELQNKIQALHNHKATDVEKIFETEIIPVLGSVLDTELVKSILAKYQVNTIYHAAAYKHVPLVEQNPFSGIKNNTFGTLSIAKAAEKAGVERFVLVSTDKAVRPTNIMGASKRLAELILQAFAETSNKTVFTIVRFGNVLDSSGSVIRRFKKQIRNGGPVTVTHPNIIRYFMSIPEAADLVIQAGAMAEGGDVFVLDMGEPIKIDDLARSLIHLLGLEIKSNETPNGDIAIEYVGLRKGEKLYEELLIGEETTGTAHPRIMKNMEPHLPIFRLNKVLKSLSQALEAKDLENIVYILEDAVEGYRNADLTQSDTVHTKLHKWQPRSQTIH